MGDLFLGQASRRTNINLGGINTQQVDLVQQARREREQREQLRKSDKASLKIQAFYRGRRSAAHTRTSFRQQFDSLLAPSSSPSPADVVLASRLLAVAFVRENKEDIKRAGTWCRAVLRPAGGGDKTPLLFSLFSGSPSWTSLIRLIGSKILFASSVSSPALPQAPLFLELTKLLSDPASYTKYRCTSGLDAKGVPALLSYLLSEGRLYESLRELLIAIPSTNRSHPSLPATIALSLLPHKAYPPPPLPATSTKPSSPPPTTPERTAILRSFALSILSTPLLFTRIAVKDVTILSAALPFEDVLRALGQDEVDFETADEAAHLLANLFLSASPLRIESIKDSKTLVAYLDVAARLLENAGKGAFVGLDVPTTVSAASGAVVEEIVLSSDDENDGDVAMLPPSSSSAKTASSALPAATLMALSLLPTRSHLLPLLTLSTRYPSSRPSLSLFLSTLLAFLPASARSEALNILLYSPSSAGLVRELFRGYVRSGALGRFLAGAGRGDATAVVASLSDGKYAGEGGSASGSGPEWATLMLVIELYSRVLLTFGDDEFHSPRNPLSLDEVVLLSSIARNAAFGLYWLGEEEVLARRVKGLESWTAEEVRGRMTAFLGEVHARDSRRPFTPEGHWHMTSQFDLQSFVQTAVYEDERLSTSEPTPTTAINTGNAAAPPPPHDDSDGSDDDDDFPLPPSLRRPAPPPVRRRGLARPATVAQTVLSKRQMALVSPRLGVLNNIPFVIPFSTRVAIFRQFVSSDFSRLGLDSHGLAPRARGGHRAVIRRNHLAEDAYAHMNGLGAELKKRVEIVFVDEFGIEESGIDGGGLFKELLTSLSKEVFDTNRGLWLATANQELYPNPHAYAKGSDQLAWFTFIGRILGAALYRGILVNVRFADFFLAKWLGRQSYLDDLASLDPELYSGLLKLKNYPGNVEDDLSLNFTVTEEDFGVRRTIDLIPNGSEIPVTNENRHQYLVLISHYRLNAQIAPQCRAFFAGLSEIISPRWLRMFNQQEIATLVGGTDEPVDVEDLRRNTVYSGWAADENTPVISTFWDVVRSFDAGERAALVRFVTSCERPPLLGFGQLNPLFAIRKAGDDQERLPTSATCVNLLKLPEYTGAKNLREKLLYAITSGAGFDLS